ncbi:flagellar biosynthetic protein FliQ [Acidocella facilis]|uniref:flagellar biosynthetic protein FliQ n=1 Tax=Acidocella facilis TaxID=525 RepID=UPI000557072C|nr:flagellar biosynthetic protein FliQ [Acidocella facilis]
MAPLYLRLLHQALATELMVLLPVIGIILAMGFVIGYLQAATQLEDATLSLMPKLLAMIGLSLTGAFGILPLLERFATGWIAHAPQLVRLSWG